jgi:hypothetical protein
VRDGTVANRNKRHFAVVGDLCGTIAEKYGISVHQFYQWNPTVGAECRGLWAEYYYCVSIPGAFTTTSGPTTPGPTGPAVPSPTREGMVDNCNKSHLAVAGDQCGNIASRYGITSAQFYQ